MDGWSKKPDQLFTDHAFSQLLQCAWSFLDNCPESLIAVGFSGGADSTALLLALHYAARGRAQHILPIHIHHGLMSQADDWFERCQTLCAALGMEFVGRRVSVPSDTGKGLEAAARAARYQAFDELAKEYGFRDICLAHHRQDQAETLLIRLFRGTGVQGMRGMQKITVRKGLRFHRLFLDIDPLLLKQLAAQWQALTGWEFISDPSNRDQRFKRGAIREQLLPVLNDIWPDWELNLVRCSSHMSEADELCMELAKVDLESLNLSKDKTEFDLALWRELPELRQKNVLRYWLNLNHQLMPAQNRLADWMRQFREVHALGFDRAIRLKHQESWIVVYRGRVQIITE